jgi:hypothetical protein
MHVPTLILAVAGVISCVMGGALGYQRVPPEMGAVIIQTGYKSSTRKLGQEG